MAIGIIQGSIVIGGNVAIGCGGGKSAAGGAAAGPVEAAGTVEAAAMSEAPDAPEAEPRNKWKGSDPLPPGAAICSVAVATGSGRRDTHHNAGDPDRATQGHVFLMIQSHTCLRREREIEQV